MSTGFDYDVDDDDTVDDGATLIKDLRRQIKALAKENHELTERVSTFAKATRGDTIAKILKDKGVVNGKVAKLIPDSVDATEEGVAAWLGEFADVFGIETSAPGGETEDAPPEAENFAAAAGVEQKATPTTSADVLRNMQNAANPDELSAFFNAAIAQWKSAP